MGGGGRGETDMLVVLLCVYLQTAILATEEAKSVLYRYTGNAVHIFC